MFWIRTAEGSIFNLATCSEILVSNSTATEGEHKGKHAVIAIGPAVAFGPNKGFIYYGTQEACRSTLEAILQKLVSQQNPVAGLVAAKDAE